MLVEVGPQPNLVAALVASAGGDTAAAFAAVVPPQLPPSSQLAPQRNWLQATSSQSDEFKARTRVQQHVVQAQNSSARFQFAGDLACSCQLTRVRANILTSNAVMDVIRTPDQFHSQSWV